MFSGELTVRVPLSRAQALSAPRVERRQRRVHQLSRMLVELYDLLGDLSKLRNCLKLDVLLALWAHRRLHLRAQVEHHVGQEPVLIARDLNRSRLPGKVPEHLIVDLFLLRIV